MFLRNAGDTASGGDDDDTVYAYINVNTHNVDTVETIILMGSKTLSAATGSWDDVIQGNDGDNIIRGGAGVDKLNGAGGNDRLFGGEGSDQLIGGKGKDELYGGERGDTFLLNSVAGSTTKASGRDTIHDFSHKEGDMIDLHLMDANTNIGGHQGLDFIGSQAFHRIAGELRYSISGNTTILFGDVDGDGKSDFALEFDGKIKFQDSDFSL
jgi:Ca2+-binding RTX toxin-like protein